MNDKEIQIKKLRRISIGILGTILILILLTGSIYKLDTGEYGVILRFGKYTKTVITSGLHFKNPFFDEVYKIKVNEIRRLEYGFSTMQDKNSKQVEYKDNPSELLLLTKDGALINVETVFQYQIKNPELYLLKVDDQQGTLKLMAEAVRRRIVASYTIDEVMLTKKEQIQDEMKMELQKLSDHYKLGINVKAVQLQDVTPPKQVDAAFKDVINAREDKENRINQAKAVANEIVPKARGKAQQMLNEAEAYKQKRIAEAKGDVANFLSIYEKYVQGKDVTRTRMYLETMDEVLPNTEIYIIDKNSNTLNYIPLERKEKVTERIIEKPSEGQSNK